MELFNTFTKMNPEAQMALKTAKRELFVFLAGYQLIYIFIVFIICIFLTHKIAGPMFKLTNYLRGIAQGEPPTSISFRDGDNFFEVADEVNNAFDRLADKHEDDLAYLTEVTSYINNLSLVVPEDKKPVIQEINARLSEMQKRFEAHQ